MKSESSFLLLITAVDKTVLRGFSPFSGRSSSSSFLSALPGTLISLVSALLCFSGSWMTLKIRSHYFYLVVFIAFVPLSVELEVQSLNRRVYEGKKRKCTCNHIREVPLYWLCLVQHRGRQRRSVDAQYLMPSLKCQPASFSTNLWK